MTERPTKQEQNVQFLYSVLTHKGNPIIDWDPIGTALGLEKGAITKRWSRFNQAMDKGEKPAGSNEQLLWLMIQHSEREKAIAQICGSTKGAVSKRYSRLKLAFERGDAPPLSTPTMSNKAIATPKKTPEKAKVRNGVVEQGTPTTTPKRRRAPAKKKVGSAGVTDDDKDEAEKPKRAKSNPEAKPRPKNGFRASDEEKTPEEPQPVVKGGPIESDDDIFTDAPEHAGANVDVDGEIDEAYPPTSIFSDKFAQARELANVLLDRKSRLNSE